MSFRVHNESPRPGDADYWSHGGGVELHGWPALIRITMAYQLQSYASDLVVLRSELDSSTSWSLGLELVYLENKDLMAHFQDPRRVLNTIVLF